MRASSSSRRARRSSSPPPATPTRSACSTRSRASMRTRARSSLRSRAPPRTSSASRPAVPSRPAVAGGSRSAGARCRRSRQRRPATWSRVTTSRRTKRRPPAIHSVPASRGPWVPDSPPLVEARDLEVHFPITRGVVLQRHVGAVRAVDSVSLALDRGKTLGLVGESGCGKSTLGRAIVRLYRPTAGVVLVEGEDIAHAGREKLRRLRRRLQMIFQDPYASLDPRMTIGASVAEPLRIHRVGSMHERRQRVAELLGLVGLSARDAARFPHELYLHPLHPYTVALLSAIPVPNPVLEAQRKRIILSGELPSAAAPPRGCRFHTRCWLRTKLGNPDVCTSEDPPLRPLSPAQAVACHFAEEVAGSPEQESVSRGLDGR